jgi:hypothetical protein
MATARNVTKPAAPSSPLTNVALDDALIQLRAAGYDVQRQGMHWVARLNGSDATVLKTVELLDLANSLPPPATETSRIAETDLDAALVEQLQAAGYRWQSAKRTPDGHWHHLVQVYNEDLERLDQIRARRERLIALIAQPAQPAASDQWGPRELPNRLGMSGVVLTIR